jgi:hypothetical protein
VCGQQAGWRVVFHPDGSKKMDLVKEAPGPSAYLTYLTRFESLHTRPRRRGRGRGRSSRDAASVRLRTRAACAPSSVVRTPRTRWPSIPTSRSTRVPAAGPVLEPEA